MIQKIIDVNAHIVDLKYEIAIENSDAIATISFTNLGYGDITAIKFNAYGYNSFGDSVLVNETDKFFLIIQDIMIKKNTSVADLKVKLPNSVIKKLKLEEYQVCYADGNILTYEGENSLELEIEYIKDDDQLKALRKLFDNNVKIQPKDYVQGWLCSCERFNSKDMEKCSFCEKKKTEVMSTFEEASLSKLVEEYKIKLQEEEEAERIALEQEEKARQKKGLFILIAVIIGIFLIHLISNTITMSQRTLFTSEEEMKEALQGTYTYYDDDGDAYRQIEIKDNQFRYIYKYTDSDNWMDISWHPDEGYIHTFESIVVTKDGDLKVDGELYEQGGYMSTEDIYSYSSSYESGYSVLQVTELEWDSNSSYNVVVGKVKNTGNNTYYFIEVRGEFKDSSGNVIDTDWTYAAGSEGLRPGESTSFRISVAKDYDIVDYSVSVYDFE